MYYCLYDKIWNHMKPTSWIQSTVLNCGSTVKIWFWHRTFSSSCINWGILHPWIRFWCQGVRAARKGEVLGWKLNFVVWALFSLFLESIDLFSLLLGWVGWDQGRGKIKLNLWYFSFNKKDVQKDGPGENRF